MEFSLIFISFILYDGIKLTSTKKSSKVTPPFSKRLEFLRYQISNQIKHKDVVAVTDSVVINENVEYEDVKLPFTPIDEHDPRKKHQRFKLRGLKTTPALPSLRNDLEGEPMKLAERSSKKPKREPKMPKLPMSKITDVFYKRAFGIQEQNHWIHCQDLITPFLHGDKKDLKAKNLLEYNDTLVLRFVQLLKVEITEQHTMDDIHSILYQISNLPIRLFQWEVSAMKLLLNVISSEKGSGQSFASVKHGLKLIFKNWNLAFGSDNAMLLKQTRLFRPPCVDVSGREGSTLTPKIVRYTKPARTKKVCPESASDEDCEEWNKD